MLQRLNHARELLRTGSKDDVAKALDVFEEVTRQDPGNFEANVRAAQILLQSEVTTHEEEHALLKRVIDHLSLAKQIRPESSFVWHLASWTRYRRFEVLRELTDIHKAIEFAETAMKRAEEMMDIHGALQAKICLAWKLQIRAEWSGKTSAADLALAAELCRDVSNYVRRAQGTLLSDYLYTHAIVRLAQGDQDHDDIEKMIQEAEQHDQWNGKLEIATNKLRLARSPKRPRPQIL